MAMHDLEDKINLTPAAIASGLPTAASAIASEAAITSGSLRDPDANSDILHQEEVISDFDVVLDSNFEIFDFRKSSSILRYSNGTNSNETNKDMCMLPLIGPVLQFDETAIFPNGIGQLTTVMNILDEISLAICAMPLREDRFINDFNVRLFINITALKILLESR